MKELINHLSCFNLNESQYWIVPDVYRRCEFEVSWFRTMTGNPVWKVRVQGDDAEWQEFDNRTAVTKLSQCGIDLLELRHRIAESILRQAVYAAQLTKSARELLGDQTIDTAIAENEVLVNNLVGKIKNMLDNPEDHENTTNVKPTRAKHLKLISHPTPD